MAEKSSFFTSLNGDRRYKASDFAEYFKTFISNGVFPNPSTNLQVIANGDMTVTISPGYAWINGYMYANTDNLILIIENSDSALKRIDRIVVRCDFVTREIKTYIKKGSFSQNPSAPVLTRDTDAYELCIAEIQIDKGVVAIQPSKIIDTRLNTEICGIVTQTINEIDTTTLYNQLQSHIQEKSLDMSTWITEAKEYFSNWLRDTQNTQTINEIDTTTLYNQLQSHIQEKSLDMSTWITEAKEYFSNWLRDTQNEYNNEFNNWFDTIKDALDGDVAGNLLNEINKLKETINNMELTSSNVKRPDGSTVEAALSEHKTSIQNAQNDIQNLQTELTGQRQKAINISIKMLEL